MKRWPLNKALALVLLVTSLLSWPLLLEAADGTKPLKTAAGQTVLIPSEVPDNAGFLHLATMSVDGRLIVLLYDDPKTDRPVDYVEAYDPIGTLLAIAWYDQYGIARTAYDANLNDPTAAGPARVLVMAIDPMSFL